MAGNLVGLLILFLLCMLALWIAVRASSSRRPAVKWSWLLLSGLLALLIGTVTLMSAKGLYGFYAPRNTAVPEVTVEVTAERVARGEHIAQVSCAHCHSATGQLPLSGGMDIAGGSPVPIGALIPYNLTPAGPLRHWSDGMIFRALRSGIDPDGRTLIAMSGLSFRFLSDEDIDSVIAYLRSQTPVDNPATGGDHPNLLFAFLAGSGLVPSPQPVTGVVAGPARGPTAQYGEYVVTYLGCRDCHGPNLAGGTGGLNPAGPSLRGAGMWSRDQFVKTIRTGVAPGGYTLNPEKMFWKLFAHLDDDELAAIHEYLRSLDSPQAPAQS